MEVGGAGIRGTGGVAAAAGPRRISTPLQAAAVVAPGILRSSSLQATVVAPLAAGRGSIPRQP